jgi:uncharacterized protein DUF3604
MNNANLLQGLIILILFTACGTTGGKMQNGESPTLATTIKADKRESYSPYLDHNYPNNVYFGDTHLHTSYSTDAGLFGNVLGPEEAYRFAKGEEVTSSLGVKARLLRALDFLVISDHAENLGLAPMIAEANPSLLKIPWGKEIYDIVQDGRMGDAYTFWGTQLANADDPINNEAIMATMWGRNIEAAEKHNNPGQFTAFIGFEWTSTPGGSNLHRNVIFRDNKDKTSKILPMSVYDSDDPEDLWAYMAKYEESTGGSVLAIAHNGNLSNGLMFDDVTFTTKKPLDKDYAIRRSKYEPLYEVTQIKGDGEAHPSLSTTDEFADFETWDKGSFGAAKEAGMIKKEYAREALKQGLLYEKNLGVNPFKFGMIGSTDSHTSIASSTEDNNFGKATVAEPSDNPARFDEKITGYLPDPQGRDYSILHRQTSSAGLAAVWSDENTRTALWDAMARKEVYTTTGTRMRVRVFAGYNFETKDINRPDFAKYGYTNGVPMGADLTKTPAGKSPSFLIKALRDPDWANLDRIQIIKGWLDANGELHERIFDVSVSDNRKINADGRCETTVGNTVNVSEATFDNSIGSPMLEGYWKDPDFDPSERAFYYVRVLEIPTPRWTTYDAKHFGIDLPTDVPTSIQERAYTSPIWYSPAN